MPKKENPARLLLLVYQRRISQLFAERFRSRIKHVVVIFGDSQLWRLSRVRLAWSEVVVIRRKTAAREAENTQKRSDLRFETVFFMLCREQVLGYNLEARADDVLVREQSREWQVTRPTRSSNINRVLFC